MIGANIVGRDGGRILPVKWDMQSNRGEYFSVFHPRLPSVGDVEKVRDEVIW